MDTAVLHEDIWTSSLVKNTGSIVVTVPLSATVNFQIMAGLYAGVLSIGNTGNNVLNGCSGCNKGVNFASLNTQSNNNWVIGGDTVSTSATCLLPETTTPVCAAASSCISAPPCLVETQRQVDISPSAFSGDFEDGIAITPISGAQVTVAFQASFPVGSRAITEVVELQCCQIVQDPFQDFSTIFSGFLVLFGIIIAVIFIPVMFFERQRTTENEILLLIRAIVVLGVVLLIVGIGINLVG